LAITTNLTTPSRKTPITYLIGYKFYLKDNKIKLKSLSLTDLRYKCTSAADYREFSGNPLNRNLASFHFSLGLGLPSG